MIEKIFKIRFCSIYECLRVTMINKVLFNRLEQDANLDSLREAYQIDTLDWTFIRALYFISRRMKTEHKFYEKNFKNTAERVIPRLINLLQWIDDQESSNQNNFIYIKLLKESGIHGLILISGPTCFLTLGGSITVVSRSSNFIYFW